jgi:DNA-directed RNA polymerase subunit RPC12/RpoP
MLALRCPHCGAISPVQLSSPDLLDCEACRRPSEVPADVERQLREAARVLQSTDQSRRQLSDTQQKALTRVTSGRGGLWAIYGAFFGLTSCWALGSVVALFDVGTRWDEQLLLVVMGLAPLVLVTLSARRTFSRLTERRQALAELCAAAPPAAPGAPLHCRVCAAPVQSTGASAVAACDYCGAHNLVNPESLARAAARQKAATVDFEGEVRSALTDVDAAARAAYGQAARSAVLVPVGALGICFVLALVLVLFDRAADPAVEFVVVEESGRRCLGLVVDGAQVQRRTPDESAATLAPLDSVSVQERGRVGQFVGRRLVRGDQAAGWTVKEVRRTLGGTHFPEFEESEGPVREPLESYCLVGEISFDLSFPR